ncbi:DMT family transporter [Pelagibius litoralis]|uniref:DMT family transporter n=1 Tax=Pelagibius litoralis TaxID=374515 RepID=A0A967KDR6_9PROT|nr:DMT family transporter [Pelagibius litoralis]NIA70365.1 DMT family transporter [Pelagibius litoralis]
MDNNRNIQAAGLALAASAILSFIDNFVQEVSEEAGLWQFQVVRALFALPLLVLVAKAAGRSVRPVRPYSLALRSVAVSFGLLIYFAALGTLPVAQAGAGLFSAPIWVLLFSALLFRTGIGAARIMAVLVGFTGALMLLQPDFANLSGASLMPLAAGLFYGLGMLLTRQICADENPLVLAFGVFATIGGVSLVLLLVATGHTGADQQINFVTAGWVTPTPRFLWLTLFQAVGAVIAVTLIAQAYRIGNPSFVAVFEYSFLVFAAIWALLLWETPTNALGLAGILIIISSGLAMTWLGDRPRQRSQT